MQIKSVLRLLRRRRLSASQFSHFKFKRLRWLGLGLVAVVVSACGDYQTAPPALPAPSTTTTTTPPTPTDLGAAGFLVDGIASILNSFASFLGQIGIGVLKWFISTVDSLNLTKGGAYRQCQLNSFDVANPVDPLASCAISIYDQFKYLPAALLTLALMYFFFKYTFQGLFGNKRYSVLDYGINVFLVAVLAFALDFIVTVVVDISSQLFLMILTLSATTATDPAATLPNISERLDKLTGLFDISKIHHNNLGVAIVLVAVCLPAMLSLLVIGVFLFLRVILFLIYFLMGVPAVTARLAEETTPFFEMWYKGLLKLAVSSLPIAIVLRLAIEVAGVIQTSSAEPIQYIIMVLIITLLFLAGGLWSVYLIRGELRGAISTVKGVKSAVGQLASRTFGQSGGSGAWASGAGTPSSSRAASSPNPASDSRAAAGNAPKPTSASPSAFGPVGSAGGNPSGSGSSNGPALTPQLLASAISTGMTQAMQSQQARQERTAGAILTQMSAIRVGLDELKAGLRHLNEQTSQASSQALARQSPSVGQSQGGTETGTGTQRGIEAQTQLRLATAMEQLVGELRQLRSSSSASASATSQSFASPSPSPSHLPSASGRGARSRPLPLPLNLNRAFYEGGGGEAQEQADLIGGPATYNQAAAYQPTSPRRGQSLYYTYTPPTAPPSPVGPADHYNRVSYPNPRLNYGTTTSAEAETGVGVAAPSRSGRRPLVGLGPIVGTAEPGVARPLSPLGVGAGAVGVAGSSEANPTNNSNNEGSSSGGTSRSPSPFAPIGGVGGNGYASYLSGSGELTRPRWQPQTRSWEVVGSAGPGQVVETRARQGGGQGQPPNSTNRKFRPSATMVINPNTGLPYQSTGAAASQAPSSPSNQSTRLKPTRTA